MTKLWPLLAVLAAVAIAILVLDPFAKPAASVVDDVSRSEGQAPAAPNLATAPKGSVKPAPDRGGETEGEGSPVAPPAADESALVVTVLDDATGTPIRKADVVVEPPSGPCPRMPTDVVRQAFFTRPDDFRGLSLLAARSRLTKAFPDSSPFPPGPPAPSVGVPAETEGAFRVAWDAGARGDLFVRATGFVFECVCGVTTASSPVTVRLKRGAEIRGKVVRADGQAIEGATIDAKPGPGTPSLPGHVERTQSGKDGSFALTGLLAGALVLTVDHPKFVPVTLDPIEPGGAPIRILLIPALVATFKIVTDNGKTPETPSLAWGTSGAQPKSGLLLLTPVHLSDDLVDVSTFGPVKVPCDAPDATFEVKAIGYSPWKSEPVPLPPEGGEKAIDVRLDRDLTLGTLKLTFEDREGKALSYTTEKMKAHPWRRDNRLVPGGIVMWTTEALLMPALPEGPYGILVKSPGYAPAIVNADVVAGIDGEQRVVLGPPAKVRVKFTTTGAETILVRFEVLWNDQVTDAYPESTTVVSQSEDEAGSPVFFSDGRAGAEGLVLSGLATGRHVIRVVSAELRASSTPVDLAEGETREVEIPVAKK